VKAALPTESRSAASTLVSVPASFAPTSRSIKKMLKAKKVEIGQ